MKVNWNELPVDRDPATVEYDDWYADYRNTSVGSKTGSWGSGAWGSEYYDFDEVCKQDVRTSRYISRRLLIIKRKK
jgi:hypothetical protein